MARDVQMRKVYGWEKAAFPDYWTKAMLTPTEVVALVRGIHKDVLEAGGTACHPDDLVIKFTKRSGGCARYGFLNFTKNNMPLRHVLHEVAHALTYGQQIPEPHRDIQGHGSRFVGCFLALLEKYAEDAVEPAIRTASFFKMKVQGPWRLRSVVAAEGGVTIFTRESKPEEKFASIEISRRELDYWRELLK